MQPALATRSNSPLRVRRHLAVLAGAAVALSLLAALLPLPASAAQLVSVRDFGAKGDGVTNDTAAIQAAVNSGVGPRTVVFPAGSYVFSNVYVKSDTTLVFQAGAKGLGPTTAGAGDVFFGVVGTASSYVKNVRLEGGEFQGRPTMGGVFVTKYAEDVRAQGVKSVSVLKCVGSNLSRRVTVIGCTAEQGRWGYAFEASECIEVRDSVSRSMTRDGMVFIGRSKNIVAANNLVDGYMTGGDVGVGGIQVYGSTIATITGNVIKNGKYSSAGVRLRDAEKFWCEGNYVESPGESGYSVVRVGDYAGITGGDGTFIGNTVVGAKLRGFDVANASTKPVRIVGNTVRNTTSSSSVSAGMGIVAMPKGCVVIGNEIVDATGAGIQVGGSGQVVAWNRLRDVAKVNFGPRVGIFVLGTSHAVVYNDICDTLGNMFNGIRLYDGSSALVFGNSISGATVSDYDIRGTKLASLASDTKGPTVSFSIAQPTPTTRTVTAVAADALSAVVGMRVSVDGAPPKWFVGSRARVDIGAGAREVAVSAIDAAGNETTQSFYPGLRYAKITGVTYSPKTTVSYGTKTSVKGIVVDGEGRPLPGMDVGLQIFDETDCRWENRAKTTTGSNGRFEIRYALKLSGRFRVAIVEAPVVYAPYQTSVFRFSVRAYLTTPSGPTVATAGRWYTYQGTLKPGHAAGTYPVNVRFYNYVRGKWVYRKTVSAKASDISGGSRYTAKAALWKGRWRYRAYHSDDGHPMTRTTFRYVTVR